MSDHPPRIIGLVRQTRWHHEATVKFSDGRHGLVRVDRKLAEALGKDPADMIEEEADRLHRDRVARGWK